MKKVTLALAILISVFSFSQAQMRKGYKWGVSLAMNSIQAQIAIPLMTNGGEVIIDADGNIIVIGDRNDHSNSYSIVSKYYINDDILLRFELGFTNLNLKAHYKVDDVTAPYREAVENEVTNRIYR